MNPTRLDALARAAMLGLLAAAQTACTVETSSDNDQDQHQGENHGEGGTSGEGGSTGDDEAVEEGVTSSKVIADLSLSEFTEMCDEADGVVETHAVCGGVVSGPGFSYDDETEVFTEHTCAGYNTCSGFSCVIDE